MTRITAADVTIERDVTLNGDRHIMAIVQGRRRRYVCDYNRAWSPDWLCTCGHPGSCPHVRAVKEKLA